MKIPAPPSGSLRGRATTWLSLFVVVGIGLAGLLLSIGLDGRQLTAVAGTWNVVRDESATELALTRFRVEPNGMVQKFGLLGRGFCWRECYTFHDVHTGRTYDVAVSPDGQVMTMTAGKAAVQLVAHRQKGR